MQLERKLQGHSGSVLMLELSEEKEWLFSSSSESMTALLSCVLLSKFHNRPLSTLSRRQHRPSMIRPLAFISLLIANMQHPGPP